LALGGNKTRKLEFLLAEAQAQGAEMVFTTGAPQSNHCRQTAAAAARSGLACTLVLAGDPPDELSANYLLDTLLGAQIIWTQKATRDQTLQAAFEQAQSEGRKPYLVPYGGSSSTGAAAYAFALQELLEQGVSPDWIVFASSSGGTQAGLVAGAYLLGFVGRILGISVDEPEAALKAQVATLASETVSRLGTPAHFEPSRILVNTDYIGAGYGMAGPPEIEAMQLFAKNEGVLVDPVYTGRAAAGLIDLIRTGFFSPDESVLFWHTGGTPALFASKYRDLIRNA
nr:D-cysteine desulfhydrase family protein [Anaerolineae bacterium]